MKKLIILISLFFQMAQTFSPVSAHTVRSNGEFGVSLHIDPDDSPVVGQPSKIFVEITDRKNRFVQTSPAGCICTLDIIKDQAVLKTFLVTSDSGYTQMMCAFPEEGTYQLRIHGKPSGKGAQFEEFTVTFDPYVQSSDQNVQKKNDQFLIMTLPYISLLSGVLLIVLLFNPLGRLFSAERKR